MIRSGKTFVAGKAEGEALVLADPLSFWGGVEPTTGDIIDRSHPDLGKNVAGRILVMQGGRGSSSSSSVLAEAIRRGTAPAGIVLARPDPILTVGAIVAQALYGRDCPLVVCEIDGLSNDQPIRIVAAPSGEAQVEVLRRNGPSPAA